MIKSDLWIVYENINTEVEIFSSYEKAVEYYTERKDEASDNGVDGIVPGEAIYLSKVERQATWIEDKDQPIYKTDEFGDETEEESGDYYWILTEERSTPVFKRDNPMLKRAFLAEWVPGKDGER